MFLNHSGEDSFALLDFRLRRSRINHARIQNVAVFIYNRNFATRSVRRVHGQNGLALKRRLHEKRFQVDLEHFYCLLVGLIRKVVSDLVRNRREDKTLKAVRRHVFHNGFEDAVALYVSRIYCGKANVVANFHRHLQAFFLFAAVYSQNPMGRNGFHRFGIIGVHIVRLAVFRLQKLCGNDGFVHQNSAQRFSQSGVVADKLRDDVLCSRKRVFGRVHAFFLVHVILCQRQNVARLKLLRVDNVRQRFQAFFDRHRSARFAFLLIRTVNVLHLGHSASLIQSLDYFVRQLALLFDRRSNLVFSFLQVLKIFQSVRKFPEHLIVASAVHLFSVTRDERNGVALFDQHNDVAGIVFPDFEFFGQNFAKIHNCTYLILL